MSELTLRQTSRGVMCQECAFKQALAETRMQAGALAPGAGGQAVQGDSLGLGLVVGLFFGVVGLLLVLIVGRGPQMKRGAAFGTLIQLTLWMAWRLVSYGQ